MADHVYRVTEVVGTSQESVAQAIRNGVARVGQTVRNVEWFEVVESRGAVAPDEAVATLYRPTSVLWDGATTWVLLEGADGDVEEQSRLLDLDAVDGPPTRSRASTDLMAAYVVCQSR